ncbi:MAG: glycosyl hydrolase, partial [Anaerolineae bacterium]|nr:glycosyl hydrolase [Anaerolineae bacterium]
MTCVNRPLTLLLMTLILGGLFVRPAQANNPVTFANCRLGLAGGYESIVADYNVSQLNLGLFLDYGSRSSLPAGLPSGIDYLQIVRVHQNKVGGWNSAYVDPPSYRVWPSPATIAENAASLPGSYWFIGNEPDRKDHQYGGQDETTPELYATIYHDIRAVIKAADPTARVGPAGIVQATPLRLIYLEKVWDSYQAQYGYSMGQDIDVWNMHGFILREIDGTWGAELPPGLVEGVDYTGPQDGFLSNSSGSQAMAAHHNVDYFIEFTRSMRQWMADHGERNKPLINTEFGILYKSNKISNTNVKDFMNGSFDFLFNATDSDIGYPSDENRLVQRWTWFSLDTSDSNGALFSTSTKNLTTFGTNWKNYIANAQSHPLAAVPQQNLLVSNLRTTPGQVVSPNTFVDFTLSADVANSGNSPTTTGDAIRVSFWDGDPNAPESGQIGSTQTIADLPGCGQVTTVQVEWPNKLDPEN